MILSVSYILWHDSMSIDGWKEEENLILEISPMHTFGYLIKETDDYIYIANSVYVDEKGHYTYACIMLIHKPSILKRKDNVMQDLNKIERGNYVD